MENVFTIDDIEILFAKILNAYTDQNGNHVRSIRGTYIQRFGNNGLKANLPTEKE
jgi:hypothetical protein